MKAGYKQTEVGVIPGEWGVAPFSALARIERGKFTARPRNDPRYFGGDIPFIQTGDVTNATGVIKGFSQTLNKTGLSVSKLFPKGTLFFTIAANIGDVGFANFDTACPDSLVAITPTGDVKRDWLSQELRSKKPIFESLASHNAQLNINLEKLRPYLLPVPTPLEQQAIATALSDADELIESLEQLLAKKRDIKQGAMQELLTGRSRIKGYYNKWDSVALGDCAIFLKGKGLAKSDIDDFGETPCIHYGELFTKYQAVISCIQSKTKDFDGSIKSVTNDVLMPTSDVTPRGLAKASCITASNVVIGGDVLIMRPNSNKIKGEFLSYTIRNQEDKILQLVTGSTVFHLYGSDMKSFKIKLPDISEQTAIAAILSDMDAEISALETKLEKARQIKQGMMQELLTGRIRLV